MSHTKSFRNTALIIIGYLSAIGILGYTLFLNRYHDFAEDAPFQGIILILFFALFFKYEARSLGNIQGKPLPWLGYALIGSGLFLNLAADIGSLMALQGLSLLIIISGIIVYTEGYRLYIRLMIPLVLIAFLFGLVDPLGSLFAFPLQIMATTISGLSLNIVGYETIQQGIYLYLPFIVLRVDPSCSGFNHVSALMIISLLIAYRNRLGLFKSAVLVSSAAVLGVLLNSLRITLIGIWAELGYVNLLHGPGEILYISSIFIVGFFILVFFSRYIPDFKNDNIETPGQNSGTARPVTSHVPVLILLYTGILIIFLWPVRNVDFKHTTGLLGTEYDNYFFFGEKVSHPSLMDESFLSHFDYVKTWNYVNNEKDTLIVCLGYIGKQKQDKEIVNYQVRDLITGSRELQLDHNSGRLSVNYKPHSSKMNRGTYSLFWTPGGYQNKSIVSKLKLMYDGIVRHRTDGALVIIQANRHNDVSVNEISRNERNAIARLLMDLEQQLDRLTY